MKTLILILSLFGGIVLAKTECKRDRDFSFDPQNIEQVKNIKVRHYFNYNKCALIISTQRKLSNGTSAFEKFFIYDNGLIFSFITTNTYFPTSTENDVAGARAFYLLPRTQQNVSYEWSSDQTKLDVTLANGSVMSFSTESGDILDISGIVWRRDRRAIRNFIKSGKLVDQHVDSEHCINCTETELHPSLRDAREEFIPAGLIIERADQGVVMDTQFRRGNDPRSYRYRNRKTLFIDSEGRQCAITNKLIYLYTANLKGRINFAKIKFENDHDRYTVGKGERKTFKELIDHICQQQKGAEGFNTTALSHSYNID